MWRWVSQHKIFPFSSKRKSRSEKNNNAGAGLYLYVVSMFTCALSMGIFGIGIFAAMGNLELWDISRKTEPDCQKLDVSAVETG